MQSRISDTLNARQYEEGVVMKVVTPKDIPNTPMEGAERIEGWTGPVSRSRQTIIEPGDSGRDIEADLARDRERLQRDRAVIAADQHVRASLSQARHRNEVARLVFRMVGPRSDLEDILQRERLRLLHQHDHGRALRGHVRLRARVR